MSVRARQTGARALAGAASLLLVLALVAGYARHAAFDSDQFSNRATAALRDDSVRALLAKRITDDVVLEKQADLITARPIIESVASGVVGSSAFTGLFRAAVRDVHRAVFDRDRDTVTLAVADVGTLLGTALQQLRPALASKVESTGRAEVLRRDIGAVTGDLARIADKVRLLYVILLVLSILLAAAALAIAPDRRRTVVELGVAVAAGGVVLVVAYSVVRSLALDSLEEPQDRAAAGGVWDAYLGDLRTASLILAGSGAVIAASAASMLKPVDLGPPLRRAAAWITTDPTRPALRVVRAVVLVGVGLLVIVAREAVITLLFTLIGVYLIYEGVSAILRLVYRAPAGEPRAPAARRARGRPVVVPLLAATLIAAAIAAFLGSGGVTTAAPATGACNGHDVLCGRSLDDVALPATHNSMSVPLPGWYASVQEAPIADQLADGIRGLLIDTHYADRLAGGRLRTDFGSREELRRQAQQDGVSPDAVDAALRTRQRLGFRGKGERGMYLCHTFCELGGTPLEDVLDDIHDFLVAHPEEVIVIINQDYVTPEDFVAAAGDAGLDEFAYRGPTKGAWPTLRQMIDRGQRAVFLAENHAGAAPWYRLAYESITEETPYAFSRVAQLIDPASLPASCEPNRGPDGAPFFLANHWITTDPVPLPSHAQRVNAYEPLLARMRECRRRRKQLPNLVAVNFYRRGDLFRVVDALNRVR
ncbi:MAG TPA: hypothetical protein VE449_05490 [Thermoleophilaceae bacterium]|jgi:hypothetical protein|nr:hypothetical protein [Thermoleophilaceae bacterium]